MKVAIQGQTADVVAIHELLSPWDVSYAGLDEAEVAIVYNEKPLKTKKTIVIPSDSASFATWVKNMKSRVVKKPGERIFVAASSQMTLTITPQTLYCFDGLVKSDTGEITPTEIKFDENLLVLTLDVAKEYNEILYETLNAKSSKIYRLFTSLPVPYDVAPKRLRELIMKGHEGQEISTFCDKLPMDALRFVLVRAIEKLSGEKIQKKTWNGKRYVCLLTHDVDTRKGLHRARYIKKLEEKYDLPSAWYIPSKRYNLNIETIKELANHGEIGAHDTKHDGKLAQLPKEKLTERLVEAKRTLGRIAEQSVEGFRAPILQHNIRIIHALGEAGYTYDTSIPTWEPKHPYTMKPHGIATAHPLAIEGVAEIPVTLPQDHQLIHVLGLNPDEVISEWMKMINTMKEISGLCTILVHPDYELANSENLGIFEDLLNMIVSDDEALVTLPTDLVALMKSNVA